MTEDRARDEAMCVSCGRVIELCAVCEGADCHGRLCHRCVLYRLKEALPHPHEHGG